MSESGSNLDRQRKSPEEILADLMDGNKRYVESLKGNSKLSVDLGTIRVHNDLLPGVIPSAAVISCADSRVTPELIFDASIGEVFVIRTAGNVVDPQNSHLLGSLEFGVLKLGARVIIVLGHTGCGAVAGAIDAEKNNTRFPGHINQVVDQIVPIVKCVKDKSGDLFHNSILENVKAGVDNLQSSCELLAQKVSDGELIIVGGYFDIHTGEVVLAV